MPILRNILACFFILIFVSHASAQRMGKILGVDSPHGDPTKLPNLCADCHFGYNSPNATQTINDKCLSCHNGTTAPAAETHRGLSCTVCHNPHHQEQQRTYGSTYSKLIHTTINQRSVKLMNSSGANSFADGDATYDGICEVCHTTTKYHRNDGAGVSHNDGANCTTCHPHDVGFSGAAGGPNCLGCHQYAMGSRRAVGPDFTSSKPHHPLTFNPSGNLNSPADNNCLICHKDYPGLHADGKVDLNPDPDNSGSQEWLGIYSDPWCMDCHDGQNPDPNYRLAGKVAPDKRTFYSTNNVHRNGTAFSGRCSDCHSSTNGHTASIKFYSMFYLDGEEENLCYGCHGGGANVNTGGRYMENIRVAYTTGSINSRSKHSNTGDLSTSDGKVFCRNCHDPHQLNHTTNLLIDPKNITQQWSGTISDFCNQCHDGTKAQVPQHIGVTVSGLCSDCHLPHSSTAPALTLLPIAGKSLAVSPATATITLGSSQQFNSIVTPLFTPYTQAVVNNLSQWGFVTTSGGSPGTEFMKVETPYIPLDRSIGYDPNANGGWGLITVTSSLNISSTTTIEDIDVYFNATHHYRGDIDLTLTHTQTGKSVHVQANDWSDWQPNLDFWYDSESPNDPHGSVNPRSTAQSLTAFSSESVNGEWILTILDTWPSDNSTNPSSPDFCKVNSWGLRVNGNIVGSFTAPGFFSTSYAGTGTVYSIIHNGKLFPAQNGLDVSVSENPLPLQATASLTVNTLLNKIVADQPTTQPLLLTDYSKRPPRLMGQEINPNSTQNIHNTLAGKSCVSCHARQK